jgi:hypothetical protein
MVKSFGKRRSRWEPHPSTTAGTAGRAAGVPPKHPQYHTIAFPLNRMARFVSPIDPGRPPLALQVGPTTMHRRGSPLSTPAPLSQVPAAMKGRRCLSNLDPGWSGRSSVMHRGLGISCKPGGIQEPGMTLNRGPKPIMYTTIEEGENRNETYRKNYDSCCCGAVACHDGRPGGHRRL